MDEPLDLERFRRTEDEPTAQPARRRPRVARNDMFLKGPVPMRWLSLAGQLPGRALHVGLALWFHSGLQRSKTNIVIARSTLAQLGVDRFAAARGLRQLEEAGLVRVERCTGRSPRVTLKEAPFGDLSG